MNVLDKLGLFHRLIKNKIYILNRISYNVHISTNSSFPHCKTKNLVICVNGIGFKQRRREFLFLMSYPDLNCSNAGTQCFPMYWYEERTDRREMTLFDGPNSNRYIRHDGITDWMLHHVQELYRTKNVTREMIFYYVYGLLHTSGYREAFETDLQVVAASPLPDDVNPLWISGKGQQLAQLHLLRAGACPDGELPFIDTTDTDHYHYHLLLRSVRCRHRSRLCPLPRHQDEVSAKDRKGHHHLQPHHPRGHS